MRQKMREEEAREVSDIGGATVRLDFHKLFNLSFVILLFKNVIILYHFLFIFADLDLLLLYLLIYMYVVIFILLLCNMIL